MPEVIFENSDVWKTIDEEELLEIRRLIMHFLISSVIHRLTHAIFEVMICSTIHYLQFPFKVSILCVCGGAVLCRN